VSVVKVIFSVEVPFYVVLEILTAPVLLASSAGSFANSIGSFGHPI
jgi:hypothetical protein